MRLCYLLGFLILNAGLSKAQTNLKLSGDLKAAQQLEVNRKYTFNKSPVGFGSLKEFKINSKRSPYIFKEERNTAWFTLTMPFKGILTFEITPKNRDDDYDWMLFSYNVTLQKEIENGTAMPLRSNNTRNKGAISSKTGLKNGATQSFTQPGKGNSYSKILEVKTGEKLALIIDNLQKDGAGFDIKISLLPQISGPFIALEGVVRDKKTRKPLSAQVTAEDDSTGAFISKVVSDPITGKYKLQVPASRALNITAYHTKYLFTTKELTIQNTPNNKLDFELDTLESGSKLILVNIHFYPNKDLILPTSEPELQRLFNFLKEHPSWSAKIIGHANNNVFASVRFLQQLSFNRAIAIKKYLTQNSISEERISCTGMGGKNPLVISDNPIEELKNLRVEVVLTNDEE